MSPTPALEVRGLSKTFTGQRALVGVDLELQPGEIRALVGQNGCGKSTMIKVLAGYHDPDPGAEVLVDGQPLALGTAGAGDHAGLRFVHQDLGLVPTLDACDNLAMGHGYERNRMRLISWRREQRLARETLRDLGYDFDVRQPTSHLVISQRTAIALARALSPRSTPPRVLVLDEPTANLPATEIERLFEVVRSVRDRGVAVLFVSHHLDEVFGLCDTVTVLRDGRHVITRPVEGLDEDALIALMIGRTLEDFPAQAETVGEAGEPVLRVRDVHSGVLAGVDLDVRPGEIVGVAGITGSGREEIALALFGGVPRTGTVTVAGREIEEHRPDRAVAAGLALVPAERHANAAFLESTLRENVSIVNPGAFLSRGLLSRRREVSEVTTWLQKLKVRPPHPERALATLSGGNQQKVMLARWMRQKPTVLVLDEPTQGVDVGAKADIHVLVEEAAAQGAAVVIVSTDHSELTRLAERVVVLRNGRVADVLRRPNIDPDRITAATIGQSKGVAA
ncbi:MAG TPA: sugar ABC transporter ATP-binding protein [Blastococcus sp.]|jgi:ribose transport system ATP-binding protein|nr:sugar ABC transporter ATP-binding protein [Blastococcus sp.]